MKKTKAKLAKPTTSSPRSRSHGTAVLGAVIPELAICGVFDVTDAEALYLTTGITTSILAQFQLELLQASGLLGTREK